MSELTATVVVTTSTPWVEHQGGFFLPHEWVVKIRPDEERSWKAKIQVIVDDPGMALGATDYVQLGGIARAQEVAIGTVYREVTNTALTQINIPHWVEESAQHIANEEEAIREAQKANRDWTSPITSTHTRSVITALRTARKALNRADRDLGLVTHIYKSSPKAPRLAVQESFGISATQADRLIKQCRAAGLLSSS
jgi:hypothetical protein